ncbi:hypothetical protein BC567DRAFT_220154 [Phyllosticta citribraziliensis]
MMTPRRAVPSHPGLLVSSSPESRGCKELTCPATLPTVERCSNSAAPDSERHPDRQAGWERREHRPTLSPVNQAGYARPREKSSISSNSDVCPQRDGPVRDAVAHHQEKKPIETERRAPSSSVALRYLDLIDGPV